MQSALEVPEDERDAFLRRACAGDQSLHREISSLLSSFRDAGGFLETPAIEEAAKTLAQEDVLETSTSWLPSAGQRISHYRIIEKLGGGGMGVVYKAEDTRLRRFVGLKFLSEGLAGHPQAFERLRREAQAASALNHPHICTIYDIAEEHDQMFIAMEYLEGETLRQRIIGKPLPLDDVLDVAKQILDVLKAAHRRGIFHRDIKPANVFITQRGDVKILDFGLAKLADVVDSWLDDREVHWSSAHQASGEYLTSTGITMGTIAYLSPEQARGEPLDARADLFSFGALLYEMATGQVAFKDSTRVLILQAWEEYAPVPVAQLNPALPPDLVRIIDKALQKDREKRYQSASEILADLEDLERDLKPQSKAGPPHRLRQFTVGAMAGLLLATGLLIVWLGGSDRSPFHHSPVLTERDRVILADFRNATGDPVFDITLRQALTVQLAQSPFLSLVSDARIKDTEQMMGQPPDARLTLNLAREVCERASGVAVIAGSIARLGSQYVLGLKALNCRTGDSLAEEQATADGKEHVLKALGDAVTRLRKTLGESLATVKRFDTPVDQATTPSLEALRAYSLGTNAFVMRADAMEGIPLLQRAISIDPNFALAYANLADRYFFLGDTNRAAANMQRAYELRGRLTEREKLAVECGYYAEVLGNMEKARQVTEVWVQTYPRDGPARGRASWIDNALGRYEEAADQVLAAVHLDAGFGIPYFTMVHQYLFMDRLGDARRTVQEALAKHLDSALLRFGLYKLGFLQNDTAGMAQQVAWASGKAGAEDVMLAFESDTAAYQGQLHKARELHQRAVGSALRAGGRQAAARYEGEAALREALFGSAMEAWRHAGAALRLSRGRDTEYTATLSRV